MKSSHYYGIIGTIEMCTFTINKNMILFWCSLVMFLLAVYCELNKN